MARASISSEDHADEVGVFTLADVRPRAPKHVSVLPKAFLDAAAAAGALNNNAAGAEASSLTTTESTSSTSSMASASSSSTSTSMVSAPLLGSVSYVPKPWFEVCHNLADENDDLERAIENMKMEITKTVRINCDW